jgi:hypothetical protein
MNTAGFVGLAKDKRCIWTLPSFNLAKPPQFCQAKGFGKNGNVGKIGECVLERDACVFELDT